MPTVTCADLAPGQRVRFTPHDPHYRVIDGLWNEVKEAADNYRANVKDAGNDPVAIDATRDGFVADLNDILADYGYPAITEPTPTTAAP